MSTEGSPRIPAGQWVAVIAVSALTSILVCWLMSSRVVLDRGPDRSVETPGQAATPGPARTDSHTLWAANWANLSDSVGVSGQAGVNATSRAKYIARLESLDLADDAALKALRDRIVSAARDAPAYQGGPLYDMELSPAIQSDFDELRRQLRKRAIEAGVDVGGSQGRP